MTGHSGHAILFWGSTRTRSSLVFFSGNISQICTNISRTLLLTPHPSHLWLTQVQLTSGSCEASAAFLQAHVEVGGVQTRDVVCGLVPLNCCWTKRWPELHLSAAGVDPQGRSGSCLMWSIFILIVSHCGLVQFLKTLHWLKACQRSCRSQTLISCSYEIKVFMVLLTARLCFHCSQSCSIAKVIYEPLAELCIHQI